MKELYINNKKVTLGEDFYFPFTSSYIDLENPTIVGLPVSKTIEIPLCAANSDIFDNIEEYNHISYANSFNVIAKTDYKLYNDGVIISEGVVVLDSINSTSYSIILYDKTIDIVDDMDKVMLNDLTFNPNYLMYTTNVKNVLKTFNSFTISESESTVIGYFNCNNTPGKYLRFKYSVSSGTVINISIKDEAGLTQESYVYDTSDYGNEGTYLQDLVIDFTNYGYIEILSDNTLTLSEVGIYKEPDDLFTLYPYDLPNGKPFQVDDLRVGYSLSNILMMRENGIIKPTFNYTDDTYSTVIGKSSTELTLPNEVRQINIDTISSINWDGVILTKTLIEMITKNYPVQINYTPDTDVYTILNTQEPTNIKLVESKTFNQPKTAFSSDTTLSNGLRGYIFPFENQFLNSGDFEFTYNSDYRFETNGAFVLSTCNNAPRLFYNSVTGVAYILSSDYGGTLPTGVRRVANGDVVGKIYIGFGNTTQQVSYFASYDLIWGTNVTATTTGTVGSTTRNIQYTFTIPNNYVIGNYYRNGSNSLSFITAFNETDTKLGQKDTDPWSYVWMNYVTTREVKVEHSQDNVYPNDAISFEKVLPAVSIKRFIIEYAKYFNLDIYYDNYKGKLVLDKKYWNEYQTLPILNETVKNFNTITFDKIILHHNTTQTSINSNYQDRTNKIWCEQVITTGYNIKRNSKEVTFDISIPLWIRPYNSWCYSKWGNNYSGSYATYSVGSCVGIENVVNFCYIKKINTINTGVLFNYKYDTTEKSLIDDKLVNPLVYSFSTRYAYDNTISEDSTFAKYSYFYTVSPYTFSGYNITKSLELNKPTYNYGYISDIQYPTSVTHYQNYFKVLYNIYYDKDGYILEGEMFIDDFNSLKRKVFNINGAVYILIEATEVDPTQAGFYSVKLLRVKTRTDIPF